MKKKEVEQILEHISQKFEDDVPGIVKMLVRKKIGKFQSFGHRILARFIANLYC